MANPNKEKNLTPFQKGHAPIPGAGRKPSHIKQFLESNGIGSADISAILNSLTMKNKAELQEIIDNPISAVLVVGAAQAMIKDIERGIFNGFEMILNRAHGKPKETIEHSGGLDITTMTQDQREARLAELLAKRNADNK
jgi:hypothetical protein